jgi:DNA-binding GntR family transcriptional regulator
VIVGRERARPLKVPVRRRLRPLLPVAVRRHRSPGAKDDRIDRRRVLIRTGISYTCGATQVARSRYNALYVRPRSTSSVPTTRSKAVASALRQRIKSGELAPGERLRQAEIASLFGVSTTPVREAFTVLAQEGLVRQDAHRGVVVFAPSLAELRETFEIRQALEPLAATLAAEALTDDDLAALQQIVHEMRTAKPGRYYELNRMLHRRIYAAANRDRLISLIEQMREVAASYLAMTVRQYDPAYRERMQAEHEAILGALAERDGERAGDLVQDHLRHGSEHIAKLLRTD